MCEWNDVIHRGYCHRQFAPRTEPAVVSQKCLPLLRRNPVTNRRLMFPRPTPTIPFDMDKRIARSSPSLMTCGVLRAYIRTMEINTPGRSALRRCLVLFQGPTRLLGMLLDPCSVVTRPTEALSYQALDLLTAVTASNVMFPIKFRMCHGGCSSHSTNRE